ncbi:hypothetical protein WJX72_003255 [[Myrmecia] bisecta]|uniref:Deoxyuridine 5'-triphosphate nucleotidohydrolase n=1 Tax=[Myrmecia] bisecta TaxID=41462 RepID=A0AAW1QQ21_9CHLO
MDEVLSSSTLPEGSQPVAEELEDCIAWGSTVTLPAAVFDVASLGRLLNNHTWEACLNDSEREKLAALLPPGCVDHPSWLEDLMEGQQPVRFGLTAQQLWEQMRAGECHPRVVKYKEGMRLLSKKAYFHELRRLHNDLVARLLQMKSHGAKSKPLRERVLCSQLRAQGQHRATTCSAHNMEAYPQSKAAKGHLTGVDQRSPAEGVRMPALAASNGQENLFEGPQAKMQKVEPISTLRVKKLSEHAVLPKRGSAGAAGYDLASAYDYKVKAHGREVVKTDLSVAIPPGTYARVAPRSGLAVKHFIDTGAGVVDEDYRGNIGVVLFNHGDTDFTVSRGDRVAQLILERILTPEVEEVEELDVTVRGAGGYGSTGGFGAKPAS